MQRQEAGALTGGRWKKGKVHVRAELKGGTARTGEWGGCYGIN